MEFWAQRTVSPVDGRVGWTVVDDGYVQHPRAGEFLRVLFDGEGRSVGTARAYAGRLALYLTWATVRGVDECRPSVEELAAVRSLAGAHAEPQASPGPEPAPRGGSEGGVAGADPFAGDCRWDLGGDGGVRAVLGVAGLV